MHSVAGVRKCNPDPHLHYWTHGRGPRGEQAAQDADDLMDLQRWAESDVIHTYHRHL